MKDDHEMASAAWTIPEDKENNEKLTNELAKAKFSPLGQLNSLSKLQLELDRNRQMHQLASKLLAFRYFWIFFFPSITITMISGLLAFLAERTGVSADQSALLTTIVGCLSVVSVFVQAMAKEVDLSHKSKTHTAIAVELKKLYDKTLFEEIRFREKFQRTTKNETAAVATSATTTQTEGGKDDNDTSKDKRVELMEEIITVVEEKFATTLQASQTPLPSEIFNAYEIASTRFGLWLFPPVKFSDRNEGKSKVEWVSVMYIVNNEVFNAFESSWFWPLRCPPAETVVNRAQKKLKAALLNEDACHHSYNTSYYGSTSSKDVTFYSLLLQKQASIRKNNELVFTSSDEENPKPQAQTAALTEPTSQRQDYQD